MGVLGGGGGGGNMWEHEVVHVGSSKRQCQSPYRGASEVAPLCHGPWSR